MDAETAVYGTFPGLYHERSRFPAIRPRESANDYAAFAVYFVFLIPAMRSSTTSSSLFNAKSRAQTTISFRS